MDYLKQSFVIQIGGPLVVSDWQIHGFVFWTGLSENYHFCAKHLGMLSSCIVVFRGGRAQFLKVVYNSTLLILSWFLWQTFGGVIRLDCCLREGGSDKAPGLSIRIVIWMLPSDLSTQPKGKKALLSGIKQQTYKTWEFCQTRKYVVCLQVLAIVARLASERGESLCFVWRPTLSPRQLGRIKCIICGFIIKVQNQLSSSLIRHLLCSVEHIFTLIYFFLLRNPPWLVYKKQSSCPEERWQLNKILLQSSSFWHRRHIPPFQPWPPRPPFENKDLLRELRWFFSSSSIVVWAAVVLSIQVFFVPAEC